MPTNRISRVLSKLPQFRQDRIAEAQADIDEVDMLLDIHTSRAFGECGFDSDLLCSLMDMHAKALLTLSECGVTTQIVPPTLKAWQKPIQCSEYPPGSLGRELEFRPDPRDDYLDQ